MSSSEFSFFRAGYVTSLDAWKRYLADGHSVRFRTKDGKPDQDSPDEVGDEDKGEDEDGKNEQGANEGSNEEEQQIRSPPLSAEAREMHTEKTQVIWESTRRFRRIFRILYRKAPLEVKARLVLPHSFIRVIDIPPAQGGKFYEWNIFIPTSWGGPSTRTRGPSDVDRKRIQTFIDGANSLIADDARRDAGGFKFSDADFKFERIPDSAVDHSPLSEKELKDMVDAGPESIWLWGLTPREFLSQYYEL